MKQENLKVVLHVLHLQKVQEEVVGAKDGLDHKQIVDPDTVLHDSVTASRSGKDEDVAKFGIGQQVLSFSNTSMLLYML